MCYVSSSHKLSCSKKWFIYYNDHSFQSEENVFKQDSEWCKIEFHWLYFIVLMNVLHSILFYNLGDKCVTLTLFFFIWYICWGTYMQRSVPKMACLFWSSSSYIYFNKQVEIYTSHLVLLHINNCTKISCFWNKWLITETLVFMWNCVIINE